MGKPSKNLPDFSGHFKSKIRRVDAGPDNEPNLNIENFEINVKIEQNDEFIILSNPSDFERETFSLGVIFEGVSTHKHKNECCKCVSEVRPNGIFYIRMSDSDDNGTILGYVTEVDKYNRVLKFEGVNNSAGIDPNNPKQTTVAYSRVFTRIDC